MFGLWPVRDVAYMWPVAYVQDVAYLWPVWDVAYMWPVCEMWPISGLWPIGSLWPMWGMERPGETSRELRGAY